MAGTPTATTFVAAEAATHLRHAASVAGQLGGQDPFSIWPAFAGQLDVAAAGLDPLWLGHDEPGGTSIRDHLAAAASAIDRIAPLEGPPDLAMWVWHLAELQRIAEQMGAP